MRRSNGRDVSMAAFRYSICFHHDPDLPDWWKIRFFQDERIECGYDEPQLAQERQNIQP